MNYRYIAAVPLIALAAPIAAQSAQSTAGLTDAAATGDEIVVTANRDARPVSTVGQAVTVIDTRTIEQRQSVVIADLLRQTPGVTVVRNGGVGTTTSVNIRGAESDQTVALIDGIKLNDPSSPGGGFNFGNLLIGNIARIEVLARRAVGAVGQPGDRRRRQPDHAPAHRAARDQRARGGWLARYGSGCRQHLGQGRGPSRRALVAVITRRTAPRPTRLERSATAIATMARTAASGSQSRRTFRSTCAVSIPTGAPISTVSPPRCSRSGTPPNMVITNSGSAMAGSTLRCSTGGFTTVSAMRIPTPTAATSIRPAEWRPKPSRATGATTAWNIRGRST